MYYDELSDGAADDLCRATVLLANIAENTLHCLGGDRELSATWDLARAIDNTMDAIYIFRQRTKESAE